MYAIISLQDNKEYMEQHLSAEYLYQYLCDRGYEACLGYFNQVEKAVSFVACGQFDVLYISVFDFRYEYMSSPVSVIMDFVHRVKMLDNDLKIIIWGYTACNYADVLKKYGNVEICDRIFPFDDNADIVNFRIETKQIYKYIQMRNTFPQNKQICANPYREEMLLTSIGCTRKCSFCTDPVLGLKKCWRGRGVKEVAGEIKRLYQAKPFTILRFADSSFEDEDAGYYDRKTVHRSVEIAQEIIEMKLPIVFAANFRTSIYKLYTDSDMDILRKAGLSTIYLGIESFQQDELSIFQKQTLEDIRLAIAFVKKHGFNLDIGFINIHPYSTMEGILKNAELIYEYGFSSLSHYIHRLMLVKGTKLYDKIQADGLLKESVTDIDYFNYEFKDSGVEELCSRVENAGRDNKFKEILNKSELYTHFFFNFINAAGKYFGEEFVCNNFRKEEYEAAMKELNRAVYELFLSLYYDKVLHVEDTLHILSKLDNLRENLENACYEQDYKFPSLIWKPVIL
ncbi:MAG: B12-binding domain-containing radical SAM protein [Coprococcus sp.]